MHATLSICLSETVTLLRVAPLGFRISHNMPYEIVVFAVTDPVRPSLKTHLAPPHVSYWRIPAQPIGREEEWTEVALYLSVEKNESNVAPGGFSLSSVRSTVVRSTILFA